MAYLAYLEPDDELTSAAARIRNAPGDRVGLVLPFNSRVATSRINFRLLAREAADAKRTLDIIAPDAAARALASAAGLAAFATVGEYEAAIAGGLVGPAPEMEAPGPIGRSVPSRPDTPDQWNWGPAKRPPTAEGPAPTQARDVRPSQTPAIRTRHPMMSPVVMGAILLFAVALGMGAAAAGLLLPAADITVTAKAEVVPTITFSVVADPAVTAPDAAARKIPAQQVSLPVAVSGDYPATGKKVAETKAAGSVRLESINTVFPVSVPKGTRLSTLDGILFTTTAATVVPRATVIGSTIKRGSATVGVTAIKPGLAGNVAAGTVTQVPGTLATQLVTSTNAAAMSGGTHTETIEVSQADVDAALKDLRARLATAFDAAVAAPSGLAAGAVAFPDTAAMGEAAPSVDPATLVGTQVETFSLSLSASGSMLAVDASPITALGEAAIGTSITAGYRLVPGSVTVQVGTGVPADGTVKFDVRASAKRVRQLDAAVLKQQVLGRREADARTALEAFGTVTISFWPGWVQGVPTNASRVSLTVADDVGGSQPGPGLSPVPSGS